MPRKNSSKNNDLNESAMSDLFGYVAPAPGSAGVICTARRKYSCAVCGAETAPRHKTCSPACRAARKHEQDLASYYRIQAHRRAVTAVRRCLECGTEFMATNSRGRLQDSCSPTCRIARRKRQQAEHARKAPAAQLSCRACGQPIERRTDGPGRQPRFCSEACRYRIQLADARASRTRMRQLAKKLSTAN